MDHGTSFISELDRVRAEVFHCNVRIRAGIVSTVLQMLNRGDLIGPVLTI